MRIFAVILGVCLVLLQYRLWVSDQGMREIWRLDQAVEAQKAANGEQRERNRQLLAEVTDLKVGLAALEERARSELGMVGNNETFYQIVTPATQAPAGAAHRHHRPRRVTAPQKARRVWAVVPAAGRGERFETAAGASHRPSPSNTHRLRARPCSSASLRPLLAEPRIERVVVVVAADDARWRELRAALGTKLLDRRSAARAARTP